MYESFKALKIEQRGKILTLTIDNPPMNAMTPALAEEMSRIFQVINRDPSVAVVVLTGAGDKAFSAGADIKQMAKRIEDGDHAEWTRINFEAREMVYGLLRLERPLITRINGHAMGMGATIAVMSDFSYMMEGAKIADTHVKVGLAAGDGCGMIWPLLMGFTRAKHYLLTGDIMTGKLAAEYGLISASVSSVEELDKLTNEMAERLAAGPTVALNYTKLAINLLLRKMLEGVIETHLGLETYSYLSKDHYAATKAFAEKQEPVFTGE